MRQKANGIDIKLVRETISKMVTFEQRPEKDEGGSHTATWGQSFLEENTKCKGSEMGSVCCDQRQRPLQLVQNE